jgi:hypothetical protein
MVVMVVMVVVVVVMVMVVMLHRRGLCGRGGSCGRAGRGGRFLRDGVAGESDGERGGGDKTLDHENKSSRRRPQEPTAAKLTQFA